jgi:hypothetical protein
MIDTATQLTRSLFGDYSTQMGFSSASRSVKSRHSPQKERNDGNEQRSD